MTTGLIGVVRPKRANVATDDDELETIDADEEDGVSAHSSFTMCYRWQAVKCPLY